MFFKMESLNLNCTRISLKSLTELSVSETHHTNNVKFLSFYLQFFCCQNTLKVKSIPHNTLNLKAPVPEEQTEKIK